MGVPPAGVHNPTGLFVAGVCEDGALEDRAAIHIQTVPAYHIHEELTLLVGVGLDESNVVLVAVAGTARGLAVLNPVVGNTQVLRAEGAMRAHAPVVAGNKHDVAVPGLILTTVHAVTGGYHGTLGGSVDRRTGAYIVFTVTSVGVENLAVGMREVRYLGVALKLHTVASVLLFGQNGVYRLSSGFRLVSFLSESLRGVFLTGLVSFLLRNDLGILLFSLHLRDGIVDLLLGILYVICRNSVFHTLGRPIGNDSRVSLGNSPRILAFLTCHNRCLGIGVKNVVAERCYCGSGIVASLRDGVGVRCGVVRGRDRIRGDKTCRYKQRCCKKKGCTLHGTLK